MRGKPVSDFHNSIMYAASQAEVEIVRDDNVYRIEGFEIKALKNTLCIAGHVYLASYRERVFVRLFETSSLASANAALARTMQLSREISRIKSFKGFDVPEIQVQLDFHHTCLDATENFIVEESSNPNPKWTQADHVHISARYFIHSENGGELRSFSINTERYTERRFTDSRYLPKQNDFTRIAKYARTDFEPGADIADVISMHCIGLSYAIRTVDVMLLEGYSGESVDVMLSYGVKVPEPKYTKKTLVVKVPYASPLTE